MSGSAAIPIWQLLVPLTEEILGVSFSWQAQSAYYIDLRDEKFKKTEWFSNKVNIINPSVFLDVNSGKGVYVRFKYYLLDFLVEDKQDIKIYGEKYNYFPESSKMFYVSIGTTIKAFKSKTAKKAGESINTTMLY